MHFYFNFIIFVIFMTFAVGNKLPKIIQSPSDVYGLLNQQVSLRCESSEDSDTVVWLRDDRVISSGSRLLVFQLNLDSEGHYSCNISNQYESVMTEKALVRVAYLQAFPPQNISQQYASPGATVLLQCPSIEGLPPPSIDWQANYTLSDPRFKMDSGNNLRIDTVQQSDSGFYWCRAKNLAYTRVSTPIHLLILQKPIFLLLPKHLRVMQGSSIIFPCIVAGESPLLVYWYKLASSPTDPSLARASLASNCSLVLTNVRLHHTGAYVARATNRAGITEIVFKLSVISPPSFIETPDNVHVYLGHSIILPCTASGIPVPRLFWYHDNDYLLSDIDGNSNSRITIFENGTLFISSVRSRDAGRYYCYAASFVGVSRTQCSITIEIPTNMFPPIISLLPKNITTVEGSTAILSCRVMETTAVITWYKQSLRIIGLNSQRGRLHLLNNGDLKISNCKIQDSAIYTCRSSIANLHSDKSAHLFVKSYSEVSNDFIMSNKEDALSAAVNISVEFVGDTYMLIKWDVPPSRIIPMFRVEVAAQFVSNWIEVAVTRETKILISNLKPDTGYKILVRSIQPTSMGNIAVLPEIVYTLDKPTIAVDSTFIDFHKALQEIEIYSVKLSSISSTQLFVSWKVRGSSILRSISGFIIKTEAVSMKRCLLMTQKLGQSLFSCLDNDESINVDDVINKYDDKSLVTSVKVQKYVVARSIDRERTKSSAIVGGLRPFMCYEVEIETFIDHIKAGRISGRDSMTKTVLTYDDLPTKSPKIKKYQWVDNTTFYVSWDKLETRYSNGPITGYIIQLINLKHKSLQSFKVSMNILEYKVKVDSSKYRYVLYLSANSCRGPGPRSWPVFIQHNVNGMYSNNSTLLQKPWILAAAVAAIIFAIFLFIILISIFICKKQRSQHSHPKLGIIPLVSSTDKEMEESFSKRKKIDKLQSQKLLSNYDTLIPNFNNSSDGFSSEQCPSSGATTVPRFACGAEDQKCMHFSDDTCNDSLAYASSSIIYKGCQHYNQPGFPPNFYGPYIDILNDQRNTNVINTESSLILNPLIPPPPLYPPPPAPKNQRNYSENTPEGIPSSQNNTHSSGSASACGSSNKSNKTRKSRTPQSVNQSLNSSSSSKSQKNNAKSTKHNRITCQNSSPPSTTGDYKKKDSLSNSTHSSQKTGGLAYQTFIANNSTSFQVQEGAQDDQSEVALTSEVSDTDTAPCDLEVDEQARDTDSLRVMYKLPVKRPTSADYSTDSSYPYSMANHYSSREPTFPIYPNNLPTKF